MALATVAFCTYNRAPLLPRLIGELRAQHLSTAFEILAVNNGSTDETVPVLTKLGMEPGVPLRMVTEPEKGIVPARNRAVMESLKSTYLVFLDDDELPEPGFMSAAIDALEREGAECVGGRIRVYFEPNQRPAWLSDHFLTYLGELNNGSEPIWITQKTTPVWCGNVGFSLDLFRQGLRFDQRFNRIGKTVGGGEDTILFESLLDRGVRIRYRPDMIIRHLVEDWRLHRRYFIRVAYIKGLQKGLFIRNRFGREFCGLPRFLIRQALSKTVRSLMFVFSRNQASLHEAMNAAHSFGLLAGRFQNHRMVLRNESDSPSSASII